MKYDYHNVKVLIKAQAVGADGGRLMSWNGRIAPEVLEEAYYKDSLSELPGILGGAIPEARDVLARTKDAQMADIVLDKAFFQELLGALEQIGSDFITAYGKLSIDAANLRTAARASRMDMDHGMLPDILIPGGDVEIAALAAAARQAESLAALYAAGPLADAAIAGDSAIDGGSLTAFEKRCDDTVTAYLRAAKRISFGEAPVVAYLHAMEAEIGTVRIIMNGRSASLPAIKIRERLRDSYV